ncbi:MAG: hypothetical protein WBA99_08095, partial [Nodosilinea sp.]
APILNYKVARQHRVKQLEAQRGRFRNADSLVPFLAALPPDLTPFGTELHGGEVAWATEPIDELFPAALPLAALGPEEATALRTWLVSHIATSPPQSRRRKPKPRPTDPTILQLSLLDGGLGATGRRSKGADPG